MLVQAQAVAVAKQAQQDNAALAERLQGMQVYCRSSSLTCVGHLCKKYLPDAAATAEH